MITFTIKFLLAFSLKTKDKPKEKKKPSDKPKKKTELLEEFKDPPYVFRLEKTCSSAHIEYEILPGKIKFYQIDVLCWQNAAKIYTADGTKIFKPVTRNGLTFVPVCIEHYLKELSIDDLVALRNAVIEFRVFTDKNKLGNAAKANKTEIIYIREFDIDRTDFVDGFTVRLNVSGITTGTKKSIQTRSDATDEDIASRSVNYQRNEAYSKLKFRENFADILYEIIDYVSDTNIPRDQIMFRDFIKACTQPEDLQPQEASKNDRAKDEAVEKKSKKESKVPKAEKSTGKFTLQMQGEIFFTDANTIFKVENHKSEVSKMFVIPNVENLLTRIQKIQLNPIIIKVKSIQNFPEELFENTRFTDVYCKYVIPCIADCKTIEKPIGNTINFMESHIFPTHTLSKIKLLEFLETKRLVVEVYGVQRHQDVDANPKMFGEKPGDLNIGKTRTDFRTSCLEGEENLKTKNILLAYCSYDLSSLMNNIWDFRAKEQLHTAETRIMSSLLPELEENSLTNSDISCEFWSHYGLSLSHINLAGISFNTSNTSPLKEWILMQNNTLLTVEAYILSPQSAALVLHQIPNTYKRLLVIAFNKEVAQQCLEKILRHNQTIACEDPKNEDILTGFVIDNGNNFAIYVEGHSVGYILHLFQDVDSITPKDAKVFFNTDRAYENRLYNVCSKWSSFYMINMKIPLEYIFKNQKIYVKGNVPLLCQKALIKLNLMFLSKTMKSMFQYDLFPTIDELVSLDIEYGVPYSWKEVSGSVESDGIDEKSLRQD